MHEHHPAAGFVDRRHDGGGRRKRGVGVTTRAGPGRDRKLQKSRGQDREQVHFSIGRAIDGGARRARLQDPREPDRISPGPDRVDLPLVQVGPRVPAHRMALGRDPLHHAGVGFRGFADEEEGGSGLELPEEVEDLIGQAGARPVVEGDRQSPVPEQAASPTVGERPGCHAHAEVEGDEDEDDDGDEGVEHKGSAVLDSHRHNRWEPPERTPIGGCKGRWRSDWANVRGLRPSPSP